MAVLAFQLQLDPKPVLASRLHEQLDATLDAEQLALLAAEPEQPERSFEYVNEFKYALANDQHWSTKPSELDRVALKSVLAFLALTH